MKNRIVLASATAVVVAGVLIALPKVRQALAVPPTAGGVDLIVNQARLRQHWVVRVEDLPATFCSVQEGGVTPGEHTLLRFTVETPNIGDRDLALGDPNAHVAAGDGLYEFATCHNHFHFRHYALYQLIDPSTGFVWRAAKHGFCMIDIEKFQGYEGDADNRRHFASCGQVGIAGNQGVSKGWSDTYIWKLGGQYFVLDGGDGQPPVPPGDYVIRITVNPPFVGQAGEPCPHLDPAGQCHTLPEANYGNNIAEVNITIPDHPGRQGVGPLKDQPPPTQEPIDE